MMPTDETYVLTMRPGIDGIVGFLPMPDIATFNATFDDPADCEWQPRSAAETDMTRRQLIPYVLILRDTHGEAAVDGIPNNCEILMYTRPSHNKETRLASRVSVGWGGHVEQDVRPETVEDVLALVENTACRELQEELALTIPRRGLYPHGVVLHDDTEVGAVHLGLVYTVVVSGEPELSPEEMEICQPRWQTLDEAWRMLDHCEVWSQFVLRWLKGTIMRRMRMKGVTV